MKKFLSRILTLLMVCCILLSLCACRESPVLQETVYTYQAPEVDEEEQELSPEDEGEQTEQFDDEIVDQAETPRDAQADEGLSSEDGDDRQSLDGQFSPTENNDWQGSGGEETPEPTEATENEGEADAVGEDTAENIETGKQIVDGAGRTVTLPENVETVSAVGLAAQMTEMLGGAGRLIAADSQFLASALAQAAFSDLSTVRALWEADGKRGISQADFETLCTLTPDVCFEISGEKTFTDAQIALLEGLGVCYVVLPAATNTDNLLLTAQLMGSVLGGEAVQRADNYAAWVKSALKTVSEKAGGADLTSLYVAQWDGEASYTLNYTKGAIPSTGTGLAVAFSPLKHQLVSTFLNAAGIVNESTRIMSTHRTTEGVYVAPMFHQFDPLVSGTKGTYYSGAGEYGAAFDLFVSRMIDNTIYYQLGSEHFPAVIAADEQTRQGILADWFWQYHPTDANGYVSIDGQSFYCGVVGAYEIYVNPQGMCDWAEGSVESPLEAFWAAYKFSGAFRLDEVKKTTSDFYQTFFDMELTDTQLRDIFGE